MSLRLNTTLALTLLGLACLVQPGHAQERAAGVNPIIQAGTSGTLVEDTGQQAISAGMRANVSATASTMNQTCTDAGTNYPHGSTWTTSCPNGSTGNVTKVCLHGRNAVQSDNCKSALPCGSHLSGDSWSGACPSGTTGSMTYKCQDGNTVVDTTAFNTCSVSKCAYSTGSVACPATADGIAMSGTMNYTCSNDTLTFTGNNCATYNKPCGAIQHGGTTTYACGTYNGNLNGNFYTYCSNGYNYVSSLQCYPKTWHYFSVGLPHSCYTGYTGQYLYTEVRCNVAFDLRGALAAYGGVPNGVPLSGVQIGIPFATMRYDNSNLYYNRRTYQLGAANYGVYDYGDESPYNGWYANACTGTNNDRNKSNSGYFTYDGATIRMQSYFGTEGAEAGGRHYHPGCEGQGAINTNGNMSVQGYAYY